MPLMNEKGKIKQLPSAYTPQQQGLNQGLLTQLQQALAPLMQLIQQQSQQQQQNQFGPPPQGLNAYSNYGGSFAPIAQQAMSQFASDTVPGLAERFTALGGGGTSLGSSGFQGALGAAGAGLQENLASLGSQYGLQQRGLDLQQQGQNQGFFSNLAQLGQRPQNEFAYVPGRQGFLPALGQGLGALGATYLGGKLF